jgi:hypothetical protein
MKNGITVHQQIKVEPGNVVEGENDHLLERVAAALKDLKVGDEPMPIFGIGGQDLDSGGSLYLVVPQEMRQEVERALATRATAKGVRGRDVKAPRNVRELAELVEANQGGFDVIVGPTSPGDDHHGTLFVRQRADSAAD